MQAVDIPHPQNPNLKAVEDLGATAEAFIGNGKVTNVIVTIPVADI